jgi:hypothetical protein
MLRAAAIAIPVSSVAGPALWCETLSGARPGDHTPVSERRCQFLTDMLAMLVQSDLLGHVNFHDAAGGTEQN